MSDATVIFNLLVAFLLGGAIGWIREKEGKVAGLRTHILVSVGSALFMVISGQMMTLSGAADPGRIASGVVTGIGFIGAGCIIQAGGGVRGITTAASIWITSAIGIAVGSGLYLIALTGTFLTVIALQTMRELEKRIIKSKEE